MNFRFLHAADLHLGSPLQGLAQKDEGVARRLASASRAAFEDLVTKALEENVAFAVIAGDVFDGDWKDASIGLFFNRQLARLSNRSVSTYFLRGNHDAESVVTKSLPWPHKVVEFSTRRPETHRIEAVRVALHGRGFPKRDVGENYALDYPAPIPGWFNIGVLHTACGRTGHENYAPCTPADLAARGYDYWALGHVHAFEIVSRDPWIIYPGNLQGRSVRECGERGAVIVEVAGARVMDVRRVLTDRARWAEVVIDAGEHGDEQGLLDAVEAAVKPHAERAEERLLAVRVTLAGAARLNARWLADPDLRDRVEAAAQRCSEDVWLERLRIATSEPRREAGGAALVELDIAASLDACAADPDLRARLMEAIGTVKAKLPGGMREDPVAALDIESILAAARALTLGRAA
ncbi:MAG TPA: DNA repair exonuclease [Roseiarcus sp.]|jgi:DNA repair exonuclease SbcCD nuclease subunit|nr:DNA repair exonuclease [Roseiarcus sp.]